jgi:hypothetical protein
MSKFWRGAVAAVVLAGAAFGEPERTLLLREDQRPEAGMLEVGMQTEYSEIKDEMLRLKTDEWKTSLYGRYGLTPNVSLRAAVPYVDRDPEVGSSESGIGDVRLGFEFVAWRDIFDYPYIMPYAEVAFPTGDEDKGLGAGETTGAIGIAGGSTAWRYTHFVADLRYSILADEDNRFSGGLAVIHELSKQFFVSAEGTFAEEDENGDRRKQFVGGMTYKPNRRWAISVHGGKEYDGERDAIGALKIAYSFGPYF